MATYRRRRDKGSCQFLPLHVCESCYNYMALATQMSDRLLRRLSHGIRTIALPPASFHSVKTLDVPTSRESTRSKVYTLANLIKACGDRMDFSQGKRLHADAQEEGLASHPFVASAIVCMYGKCGAISEAEDAFRAVCEPDAVLCNALLAAYVKLEQAEKTLFLYRQMNAEGIRLDLLAYLSTLQACRYLADRDRFRDHSMRQRCLEIGRAFHSEARRRGFTVDARINTALVCMYAKCHSLMEAENVFSMSTESVVSWNAMLSAYVEQGHIEMTLWLYRQMEVLGISPDHLTIVFALQACRLLAEKEEGSFLQVDPPKGASLEMGRTLHAAARSKGLDESVYVGTTLVNVFGKCDSIKDAEEVFNVMGRRTVVSWNAMLSAYIELGHAKKALLLYSQMQKEGVTPDQQSVVSALHACGNLMKRERALNRGEASLLPIAELGRCLHAVVRNVLGFLL